MTPVNTLTDIDDLLQIVDPIHTARVSVTLGMAGTTHRASGAGAGR